MILKAAGKPPGCKLIRLEADIEGGLIRSLKIKGDFFASPEESFDRLETELVNIPAAELAGTFDKLAKKYALELSGISGAGLASILDEELR